MLGRSTKIKAMLTDGRCLNYLCDARLSCDIYDKNPTTAEKESYLPISMRYCPRFIELNPVTPRDPDEPKPVAEQY